MNTNNIHLWELIKSMSPAEKRYFKVHFSSKGSLQESLFNELNQQKKFDNEELINQLEIDKDLLKVLKSQLHTLIMKSLIAQSKASKNIESAIYLGLVEVDLLLEREHYKAAHKKLNALYKKSQKHGLTLLQYLITEKIQQTQYLTPEPTELESYEFHKKISHYQQILAQQQQLLEVQLQLNNCSSFTPNRQEITEHCLGVLMSIKGEYLDNKATLLWFQNLASYYELSGQSQQATDIRKNTLNMFIQSRVGLSEHPYIHLSSIKEICETQNIDSQAINKLINRASKIIALHPQYSPHYIYFIWIQIKNLYTQNRWKNILNTLDQQALNYIKQYNLDHLNTSKKIHLILACTHLLEENFDEAQHHIFLFNQNLKNIQRELVHIANIIELCILWDSQQLELLRIMAVRFKRQLKPKDSSLYKQHLIFFLAILKSPYSLIEKSGELLLKIGDFPFDPILEYYSLCKLEKWVQAMASRKKWKQSSKPDNIINR